MNEPLPTLNAADLVEQEATAYERAVEAEQAWRNAKTLIGLEQAMRGEGRPAEEAFAEMRAGLIAKYPELRDA